MSIKELDEQIGLFRMDFKPGNWRYALASEFEKEVLPRYEKIFHPDNLDNLTADNVMKFLSSSENKHWSGINRQDITKDMNRLIDALRTLLNEEDPIPHRFNILFPQNRQKYVKCFGKSKATPILLVVYPQKYGVWNGKVEKGLKKYGLLSPNFDDKMMGHKYLEINRILNQLSEKHKLKLYELDYFWDWDLH